MSIRDLSQMAAGVPKPRISFTNKVWLYNSDYPQPVETFAANISETGIFLQTNDPPKVGSHVQLKFVLDEHHTPIFAKAEVIWSRPFEPINVEGLLPGMGLRFLGLDRASSSHLRRFIGFRLNPTQREVH